MWYTAHCIKLWNKKKHKQSTNSKSSKVKKYFNTVNLNYLHNLHIFLPEPDAFNEVVPHHVYKRQLIYDVIISRQLAVESENTKQ